MAKAKLPSNRVDSVKIGTTVRVPQIPPLGVERKHGDRYQKSCVKQDFGIRAQIPIEKISQTISISFSLQSPQNSRTCKITRCLTHGLSNLSGLNVPVAISV